jgi:two-component system response regulator NreC
MLVDDHGLLRDGLRGLLETSPLFRVVAEAARMEEALRKAQDHALDLVVTDLEMPRGFTDGIELTKRLRAAFPALFVLIYTMHHEEEFVLQAIEADARGYVVKEQEGIDLMDAINKVVNGRFVFPQVSKPEDLLTPAERQVLWLLGDGKSNKHIAAKLSIVGRTVEGYRSSISEKFEVFLQEGDDSKVMLIHIATKYRMRCPFPSR